LRIEIHKSDVVEALVLRSAASGNHRDAEELLAKGPTRWREEDETPPRSPIATAEAKDKILAAINQKDKHTRIQAVERVNEETKTKPKATRRRTPRYIGAVRRHEYGTLRAQVSIAACASTAAPNEVRAISIDIPAAMAHGSVLPRAGRRGTRRRHARHGERRPAPLTDHLSCGNDQVVHAALQLPAVRPAK
jgi:polyribonucleotide nucleotidyltransferase